MRRGLPGVRAIIRPATAVRRFAEFGVVCAVSGALGLGLLELLPPVRSMDPMSQPLSMYALTGLGWLFDGAVLALAVGVGGVLCALVLGRCVRVSSMAFVAMTACCAGLIAIVIFPDYTSAGRLTMIGWLHWIAAVLAFTGPPIAPLVLARRHRSASGCSRLPATARMLSFTAVGCFVFFLGGTLLEWMLGIPVWRVGGIVERTLATTEIAIAVVLAVWVWRGCPCGVGWRPLRHRPAPRADERTFTAAPPVPHPQIPLPQTPRSR